jgi:hypothetical protein
MKSIFNSIKFTAAALAIAAVALTGCGKDDGGDGPETPAAPVITITTQPTAPAALTEGEIPADTKLTVAASVTEGKTLSYQWYSNTSAGNTGGTAISGATANTYTLPTTLAAGTYYYFCEVAAEGATAVRSNAVTVTVAALNSRITWKDGKYALTTDPTDAGLYFRFGSVAGIYSGNGAVQTLPGTNDDAFDAGDVAWNPVAFTDWAGVPYSTNVTIDKAYHTAANVKTGKGDPCRLVGLDLNKIQNTAAGSLTAADIDNGTWRLPTNAENQSFSGYTSSAITTAHWTTIGGVKGGMFPDATDGSAETFLPAAGLRDSSGSGAVYNQGSDGYYWSSTPLNATGGYSLDFSGKGVYPQDYCNYAYGFSVRCVRQ